MRSKYKRDDSDNRYWLYLYLQNLADHKRNIPNCQPGDGNWCKKCSISFRTGGALKNHMNSHVEHYCKICGKHFERQGKAGAGTRLQWHMRRCNGQRRKEKAIRAPVVQELKHKCKGCDELFSNKKHRTAHQVKCSKIIHQCSRCHKKFDRSNTLSWHINTNCSKFELPTVF